MSRPGPDPTEGRLEIGDDTGRDHPTQCRFCKGQVAQHDRVRVYPDDGPPGSWHYQYRCPDGEDAAWKRARGWTVVGDE